MANSAQGGFDGGAVAYDGTVEKEINLKISFFVRKHLQFAGFKVIMTRTDDVGTDTNTSESIGLRKKNDLKNRLKLMEDNPDSVYVSIHLNKFTTSAANGAQVFYTPNFPEASKLGQHIQRSIVQLVQPENTRVIKQGTNSTYLLKNAKIPAVIVECGFLSNKIELELLKTEDYQQKISFAVATGIIDYFNTKDDKDVC